MMTDFGRQEYARLHRRNVAVDEFGVFWRPVGQIGESTLRTLDMKRSIRESDDDPSLSVKSSDASEKWGRMRPSDGQ